MIGTNLAFQRGAASGFLPTRPALVGGTFAATLIVAVGVVVGGVDRLYTDSAAHGWPWDVVVGNTNFAMSKTVRERLVRDDRLVAAVPASYGDALIGGRSVEALAIDPSDASPPVVLSGRPPASATEIAIGAKLAGRSGPASAPASRSR